ncbi:MAG: neocarzinostatin apoprotein domain-containing protein [Acidimicrobiia bacterium]
MKQATINDPVAPRRVRRVARSRAGRRRVSRIAAVLLACGTTLFVTSLFFVGVGGAKGSLTVNPSTGLIDGQQVTLTWTGLTPNFSPVMEQCKASPVNPTQDCDFLTLVITTSDASGGGSDTFNVFGGLGPSHLFACDNQNDCSIRVADDPNDITTGAIATVSFSTTATTTPSTSSSSTSSTSSTSSSSSTSSTSSSSSTSTTSSPDGSTTSTSSPDGSTTTSTTLGTSVLGNSTSSGDGSGGSGLVLAFTGTALHLPYTLFAGVFLFAIGLLLRRIAFATA